MTPSEQFAAQTRQVATALRTPRGALRGALLIVLLALWCALGVWAFRDPMTNFETRYDLVWWHTAGRFLFAGGNPYSPDFAALMLGDRNAWGYPYPLASLWIVLPLLPLPIPWAALIWVSVSLAGTLALYPLLDRDVPRWAWLLPVLFFPSLYAFRIVQWAPLQVILLAVSLRLFRRGSPFWAGFLAPLVTVKPSTGLGLFLLLLALCATDRRWWRGLIAGGLLWYGAPLLIQPDWPLRWMAAMRIFDAQNMNMLTIARTPDGMLCVAAAVLLALWSAWRRRWSGLGCALLIAGMLVAPHRAPYDFPVFLVPLLLLPRRHLWLAVVAVVLSWGLPLTFELGWNSSLQLTLFTVAPTLVACVLVEPTWPPPAPLSAATEASAL